MIIIIKALSSFHLLIISHNPNWDSEKNVSMKIRIGKGHVRSLGRSSPILCCQLSERRSMTSPGTWCMVKKCLLKWTELKRVQKEVSLISANTQTI